MATHDGPITVVVADGAEHAATARLASQVHRGLTSWSGEVSGDVDWFALQTTGEPFTIRIGDRDGEAYITNILVSTGSIVTERITVQGSGPPPFGHHDQ